MKESICQGIFRYNLQLFHLFQEKYFKKSKYSVFFVRITILFFQENASRIFKDVLDSRAVLGEDNEAQAAACLYIACRKDGVPRTFKEICAVSRVSKKEIGRCFKIIIRNLETNLEQITSADFMSRFCGNLYLPNSIQAAATRIAKRAVDMDLVAGYVFLLNRRVKFAFLKFEE